jgi:integrase
MIKRPSPEHQRDRVLTEDEIRQLWSALDAEQPSWQHSSSTPITAQRGGEVHGASWSELTCRQVVDDSAEQQERTRSPLSPQSLKILQALRAAPAKVPLGLSSTRKPVAHQPRSEGDREVAARSGVEFRGHDLRRTAASLMVGAGVPRLVVSKILNHVESGVTAVYDRYSYDAESAPRLTSGETNRPDCQWQTQGQGSVLSTGRLTLLERASCAEATARSSSPEPSSA